PAQTVGNTGTSLGNVQVIFKGILYQTPDFLLSGGLGVTAPTGPDTNIRVTDYIGPSFLNSATYQRVRTFRIENATWSVSPFLAYVSAPATGRWFHQGFLEFETPLNSSRADYLEVVPLATIPLPVKGQLRGNQALPPIAQSSRLNE